MSDDRIDPPFNAPRVTAGRRVGERHVTIDPTPVCVWWDCANGVRQSVYGRTVAEAQTLADEVEQRNAG